MNEFNDCLNYIDVIKNKLDWIPSSLVVDPKSLLNVGCNDGKEALLLQWKFQPSGLVVVDKEPDREERLNNQLPTLADQK